mmetsp:Transcript_30468/g.71199  ORF Transcript_30468/g.71199 Transcript_30468/m.71199 type:complete len:264 (-) Transcript_30468:2-793(-)
MALLRLFMTSLRIAVPLRMSCNTTLLSDAVLASTCLSTGLNRTLCTLSLPQLRVTTASLLSWSQTCTSTPHVATRGSDQWWSRDMKGNCPMMVCNGATCSPPDGLLSHILIILSSPHVHTDPPSGAKATPLTKPLCACTDHRASPRARSHSFSSPSQLPLATSVSFVRERFMQHTPSRWPLSALTKGFAKTLSSLVALSARVYSRALSNGCTVGSGFLKTLATSPFLSRVKSSSTRFRTLTFMTLPQSKPPPLPHPAALSTRT